MKNKMRQIQPEIFNSKQKDENPNKNYVPRQKLIDTFHGFRLDCCCGDLGKCLEF